MRFAVFLISSLALAADFATSLGDQYPYTIAATTSDSAGNTYVVGSRQLGGGTLSLLVGDFSPTLPIVIRTPYFAYVGTDVFVSKLDPTGKLLFTDTFAGKGIDTGTAIALDPSGNIYIAGTTTSTDFPLTNALQTQPNPTYSTGFIIKLTNDGKSILYSTYFGGSLGSTSISSLATDSKGNLYLTGATTAADFPHTPGMPFDPLPVPASGRTSAAIMTAISAAGDKILYSGAIVGTPPPNSRLISSAQTTTGAGIAVDAAGEAFVAGNTIYNLPTTPGVLDPNGVGAFVVKVNATGTGLSYLTYLSPGTNIGGMSPTSTVANVLYSIAVDASGNAYLAGATSDPKFPTTPGSLLPKFNIPPLLGLGFPPIIFEGFLAKLKPDGSGMVWATYLDRGNSQGTNTFVQSIAIDQSGNTWATGITGTTIYPNPIGVSTGPEFVVGLNSSGSALTYQSNSPIGTIAQSVSVDSSGVVHVAGINGFVSTIVPTSPPSMKITDFQNAAGGSVTARISPAEIIAIFGQGIGPATAASATPSSGFYPTTLGGVQVTINGMNMPLLYVSSSQINAVVPMELAVNSAATVRVVNGTTTTPGFPVWILASAAEAFPPVVNQDGTINSATNPAKSGSTVTFYATGWQSSFSPLTDGQVAPAAQNVCNPPAPPPPVPSAEKEPAQPLCEVTPASGVSPPQVTVAYAGAAPGSVAGLTQFNIQIGAVAMSNFASQFIFSITGPALVTQAVWIAH
jgi:uncharacterized protein (TIGR03437 family)